MLADGTPVHREPLATRYTKPRTTPCRSGSAPGVLKLARPGEPWSVWLFWERGWRFQNWYVNLEEPLARWAGGVDSEDHFLDISVYPDRSWRWQDEDEFAQAQRAGLMGPRAGRAGTGGGPGGRGGHRVLGRAVPGRLGGLAAGSVAGRYPCCRRTGTVSTGAYVGALEVLNLLLCPRVSNVGSSSGTLHSAGNKTKAQLTDDAHDLTQCHRRGGSRER